MGLRKLKPREYLDEFYHGSSYTTQTVRNWIRKGQLKHQHERTPGGHIVILVEDQAANEDRVQKLVSFLES